MTLRNIQFFPEVTSTQDKVFELLKRGEEAPLAVLADHQTSGRGRLGRQWQSEKGRSLLLSLGYRHSVSKLAGLSLAAGVSLINALQDSSLMLKWPNDIMLGDQKVGGILIETRSQGSQTEIAIGIGLNLFSLHQSPYHGLGRAVDGHVFSESICDQLELFWNAGFDAYCEFYEMKLWKKGQSVEMLVGDTKKNFHILGVASSGALRVKEGQLELCLDSGEIIST